MLIVPKLRNPKLDYSYKHIHTNAGISSILKIALPLFPIPFQLQLYSLLPFTTKKIFKSFIYSHCVHFFSPKSHLEFSSLAMRPIVYQNFSCQGHQ